MPDLPHASGASPDDHPIDVLRGLIVRVGYEPDEAALEEARAFFDELVDVASAT